jgi:DNA N-6-adenine-methyltransferase (Dam)
MLTLTPEVSVLPKTEEIELSTPSGIDRSARIEELKINIRQRTRRLAAEVLAQAADLCELHELLMQTGEWVAWVKHDSEIGQSSIYKFLAIGQRLINYREQLVDSRISQTVIEEMARPETPEPAILEIIDKGKEGLSQKAAQEIILKHQYADIGTFKRSPYPYEYELESPRKSYFFENLGDAVRKLPIIRERVTQATEELATIAESASCLSCQKLRPISEEEYGCEAKSPTWTCGADKDWAKENQGCGHYRANADTVDPWELPAAPSPQPQVIEIPTKSATTALMSSSGSADPARDEQYTPAHVWEAALSAMGTESFALDIASYQGSPIKSDRMFTIQDNALIQDWEAATIWGNPPYSQITPFTNKLLDAWAAQQFQQCCWLTKSDNRTKWYQRMVKACTLFCLIEGGLVFENDRNGSGSFFGSTVFYFGDQPQQFAQAYQSLGTVCSALPQ